MSALQAAVIAALQTDGDVAALVGDRVLEEAQASAVFPYLAIGPWKSRAWNVGGTWGEEVVFGIVAFVRKGGRGAALNLIGRCGVALDGAAMNVDGGRVVGVFFQDAEVALEKDRQTWRAVGKFRALVEHT